MLAMKQLIILFFILCLCSCVKSKYRYEIRYADTGEIAYNGEIETVERKAYKGEDSFSSIRIKQIETKDTVYVFYVLEVRDKLQHYTDTIVFDKPVYVSKFYVSE